jgi:hypothetical protein
MVESESYPYLGAGFPKERGKTGKTFDDNTSRRVVTAVCGYAALRYERGKESVH